MEKSEIRDFLVNVSPGGAIDSIRGIAVPDGLLYAPVPPNTTNSISASAMHAMTSAINLANEIQQRASRQAQSSID